MDEYRKILCLKYLNDAKEEYIITKIFKKLGIGLENGFELINVLFEEKLIYKDNNLIKLTTKALNILKEYKSYNHYYLEEGNIITEEVDIKNRKSVYETYVPKRFSKKI